MPALKGNEYYKLRSKDGRDKIFKTPETLKSACNEYFEWCIANPLIEELVFHSQGVVTKTEVSKARPFTLDGLCNYIDISVDTFRNYEKREDFIGITTRVRQIIYNQKFEGASVGFFNPNIIARDLGLSDKKEVSGNADITINFED